MTQVASVALCAVVALGSGPAAFRLVGIGTCVLLWSGAEIHLRSSERPEPGAMRVTFVDVGQGDAALLQLGTAVLAVDGGGLGRRHPDSARIDPAARAIRSVLQARRLQGIDVAVVTHPHPDHFGGIASLAGPFVPRTLWATRQASVEIPRSPAGILEGRFRHRLRRPKDLCRKGARFRDVTVRVLWPCPGYDPGLDLNDNSIVLTVTHAGRRFLFTGDIEAAAEEVLVARYPEALRADILKAPHHGSRTSSSAAFLEAVRPRVVVVSAGPGNRFGHPHDEVLRRYRKYGARVFRTDRHGRIDVWSRRQGLQIETVSGRTSRIEGESLTSASRRSVDTRSPRNSPRGTRRRQLPPR